MAVKRGRKSADQAATELNVVKVSGGRVPAPEWLDELAKAEFDVITSSLPANYFRAADVHLLAMFCCAAVIYKEAYTTLKEEGMVLYTDNGRSYANPLVNVMQQQASAMAQMSTKLRLAPSARTTGKAAAAKAREAKPSRPWEPEGMKTGTDD